MKTLDFFCDASVDSQNLVAGNQTGIGVLILTQPARSISLASFFFFGSHCAGLGTLGG